MLSNLQKFILEECLEQGGTLSRRLIDKKYEPSKSSAKAENFKKVITQSIERLIDRGFVVGYGIKTKEKLFITKIRLTALGRRAAKQARQLKQKKLPLKRRARK